MLTTREAALSHIEVLSEFCRLAWQIIDPDVLMDQAARLMRPILNADFTFIGEVRPNSGMARLRAGAGWNRALFTHGFVPIKFDGSRITLDESILNQHGIQDGVTIVIPGKDHSLGFVGAFFSVRREFSAEDTSFLQGLANILAMSIEREVAASNQHLQLGITKILAESSSLEEAGRKLLPLICESYDWKLGAIWVIDHEAKLLRCKEIWSSPHVNVDGFAALSHDTCFSIGQGLPGRVWAKDQPVWVSDVLVDSNFPRATVAAQYGLHAAFCFPIRIKGAILGVMEFFTDQIREPESHCLRVMSEIGLKTGQFLERQRAEELSRADLVQSKVAAMVQIAASVAHELSEKPWSLRKCSVSLFNTNLTFP